MTSTTITCSGILFDMDGTLIDSKSGIKGAWSIFQKDYPHLDPETILKTSHGVRSIDTLRKELLLKDDDEDVKLREEVTRFESEVIANGLELLPGVHALLEQLREGRDPTKPGWTIVTSATGWYTPKALESVNLQVPIHIVTAEDVARGKPHPDPYEKGAANLGLHPNDCVVVEDAPSGVRAGKAAGAIVVAVCTSHAREQMEAHSPDYIVQDLTRVSAKWIDNDKIELTLDTSP